ncbi:hypothetical protein [uncultured Eudoraea sp.]|uniref:hypothetical protein n=1 Tax=uncultured Eudoraea sp. TaxID=1035614 RepID=UPI002607F515|nr:hypothetical protein [uncultured Eudoraea sp.]
MRKFSFVLVAAVLLTSGNLFATEPTSTDPNTNIATQIGELLERNNFIINDNDLTANVLFTLNADHEIVVISVDTEDDVLEMFVKSRLNYKKVQVSSVKEGKMYTVPVRITE